MKTKLSSSLVDEMAALPLNSRGNHNGADVIAVLLKHVGKPVGARIKELRQNLNIPSKELAKALKMRLIQFNQVEEGTRAISFDQAEILAKELKSSVLWIMAGKQ